MTTETKNQEPVVTIRDRFIKASIWKNDSKNGAFYSVTVGRTYTVEEKGKKKYKDANSFSGSDLLVLARVLEKSYDTVAELEQADYEASKDAPAPSQN